MPRLERIAVMISSRCNDEFDGQELSCIRRELAQAIRDTELFGYQPFDVWINEEAPPAGGDWNSTEVCLNAARSCDVMIVLFNGSAGGASELGDLGICHAEAAEALRMAPGKVRVLKLKDAYQAPGTDEEKLRDQRFSEFLEERKLFRGSASTVEQLRTEVWRALGEVTVSLAKKGVRESSTSGRTIGQALDWSRLSYIDRKRRIEESAKAALLQRAAIDCQNGELIYAFEDANVMLRVHAVPDSLQIADARELVGRPFMRDFQLVKTMERSSSVGPFHLIFCHKNATETQAKRMLGFPDAQVIQGPFGIYVADGIQKTQFALIRECSDEQSIRMGIQRLMEWLSESGEQELLRERCESRMRILQAVYAEQQTESGGIL